MTEALPFHQRIYDMLMESQYWPPEQMLEYQRSQLAQLLKHAKAKVPFYKDRLDPVFKGNGDINWDRWHEIPVVKRRNLVEDRESMWAAQLPPGHGATWEEFSSGSSGTPVTTRHNLLEGWVSNTIMHRAHRWYGMDWSKTSVSWRGDDGLSNWPEGSRNESWAPSWLAPQERGENFSVNRATLQENAVEFMLRKRASYWASRPKLLQAAALFVKSQAIPVKLETVLTFGTGLTEDEGEDIREAFGARVLALYSSEEGCKIACSCPSTGKYHVNAELNFFEVLDGEDRPCAVGQPGRVVITPMFNTAQPLIRYEQGDIAIRAPACSCGRQLPVLEEISGRVTDLFRFPDGSIMSPSLPNKEFVENFGCKTWQIVQTGPLDVEVRYVQEGLGMLPNMDYARDVINRRIRDDLNVTFVALQETPLTASGKFIQYKSELKPVS